ncbi:hypothetical protein SBA3_1210016 [Candidatus Sulfopaludibacter sp. SbA3]|nr:hypothetical protein SBA3_1210016 [Candidatus Sulfopaludibacter sp. SbA3]
MDAWTRDRRNGYPRPLSAGVKPAGVRLTRATCMVYSYTIHAPCGVIIERASEERDLRRGMK